MKIKVENHVKKEIKTLFNALQLRQASLESYGVSASLVNHLVNTNENNKKTFHKDTIRKLLSGLEKKFEEYLVNEKPDTPEKNKLNKKIEYIKDSLSNTGKTKITPPGFIISIESENYQERDADKRINDAIEEKTKLVFIIGGYKTGKSSILARVSQYAKSKDLQVYEIDFHDLNIEVDVISIILKTINPKSNAEKDEQLNEIERNLTNNKKEKVILIDNVDSLDEKSNQQTTLLTFAERLSKAIEDVSFFIVYGGIGWNAFHRSKILTRGDALILPNFTEKEIIDMLSIYQISNLENKTTEIVNEIYNYTLGQPYITHLTIELISDGKDINEIVDKDNMITGKYLDYWNILKERMTQEYDGNLNLLLKLLDMIRTNETNYFDLTSINHNLDQISRLFTILCLFTGPVKKARIAGFYQKAIKLDDAWIDELGENYG